MQRKSMNYIERYQTTFSFSAVFFDFITFLLHIIYIIYIFIIYIYIQLYTTNIHFSPMFLRFLQQLCLKRQRGMRLCRAGRRLARPARCVGSGLHLGGCTAGTGATWKFNCLPLKIIPGPKRERIVFQPSIFQGLMLNFGGKTNHPCVKRNHLPSFYHFQVEDSLIFWGVFKKTSLPDSVYTLVKLRWLVGISPFSMGNTSSNGPF